MSTSSEQKAQNVLGVVMAYNNNQGTEPLDDQATDVLADMMLLLGSDRFFMLVDRAGGHVTEERLEDEPQKYPQQCYIVTIARDVTECHTMQEVWASDEGEAEELALAAKDAADEKDESFVFEPSQHNEYRPYIACMERDEEKGVRYV